MPLLQQHEPKLHHHVDQGEAWLVESRNGTLTVPLSYAALEFRYAIERLAAEYWKSLLNRPLNETDLRALSTYKKLEKRLYELAGHQREIDKHFEFMRALCEVLGLPSDLPIPNLGRLSDHWHTCSELCHIGWPLSCSAELYRDAVFASLQRVRETLGPLVRSPLIGWPVIHDPNFAKLRDNFVAGGASIDIIRQFAEEHGLWAELVDGQDIRQAFAGKAIPPRSAADAETRNEQQ